MGIKEILDELPFKVTNEDGSLKSKEAFYSEYDKHLSILATKAEIIGEEELTNAIDILRQCMKKFASNEFTKEDESTLKSSLQTLEACENRLNDDDLDERLLLRDEITAACQGADEALESYREKRNYVNKLEMEYRKKYGEPSGRMNEDAFLDEL